MQRNDARHRVYKVIAVPYHAYVHSAPYRHYSVYAAQPAVRYHAPQLFRVNAVIAERLKFVEPDEFHNIDTDRIESCIRPDTKAVLSVNLYEQACKMDALRELCGRRGLYLVEDSVLLVPANTHYDPDEYIRDLHEYYELISKNF